jgi:hypothetical protein
MWSVLKGMNGANPPRLWSASTAERAPMNARATAARAR